jgi:hypothetical protein
LHAVLSGAHCGGAPLQTLLQLVALGSFVHENTVPPWPGVALQLLPGQHRLSVGPEQRFPMPPQQMPVLVSGFFMHTKSMVGSGDPLQHVSTPAIRGHGEHTFARQQ